jgi:hypothetical protein
MGLINIPNTSCCNSIVAGYFRLKLAYSKVQLRTSTEPSLPWYLIETKEPLAYVIRISMKPQRYSRPIAYVAFGTFVSVLDNLRMSSLTALDPADCGALSTSTWSHLTRTLRFLDLIDEHDVPTESFKSLVQASNRKPILRELLKRHYPDLFDADLSRLSVHRLENLLADHGISRTTLSRARSFFLGAARYSGIRLSPELSRIIRHRVKRPSQAIRTEPRNRKQNTGNETVSVRVKDMSFSFSFPSDFAKLTSVGRGHLYHLLDEAVLMNLGMDQDTDAAADRQHSQIADVDLVVPDPSDEAVH